MSDQTPSVGRDKEFFWRRLESVKTCLLRRHFVNSNPSVRRKASLTRLESGAPMKNQARENAERTAGAPGIIVGKTCLIYSVTGCQIASEVNDE